MRRLRKAYLEITNVCNLACDFCPGTRRVPGFLSPEGFRTLAGRLRPHTDYLYLHLMGEPLLHPQLGVLLEEADALGFQVMLTTNGTLLRQREALLLGSPAVEKVSVSVHSFEGNGGAGEDLEGYLDGCIAFARAAAGAGKRCALRLWNLDGAETEGPTVKTARSSPGSGRHFPGPGGRTGGGPPWPRAFTWSLERNSSGPTCPLQRRRAAASATACGTRWAYCGTARWCRAVWTTRGRPSWEPVRDIPGGDPVRPAGRCHLSWLFPGGRPGRPCAGGAPLPEDFSERCKRRRSGVQPLRRWELEGTMEFSQWKERYSLSLDEQQEQAVQAVDGPVLLLAVPGSGKTTVLVSRVGYLCLARGSRRSRS